MYELLLELIERLNQIAIVGLGSVTGDFRLKKLEEKLKLLSSKAPVLAKLYALVAKLLSGEESVATFMELNSLVDAILSTQGTSKPEGIEKEVMIYQHQGECNLTFMQLQEARNILKGGTNTKWASLKKAYSEGKLYDFRLLEDFLDNIGDNYEYTDFYYEAPQDERKPFSMLTILEQFGKDIIPILLQRFESYQSNEKANAVKLIYRLAGAEYNDLYKKWAENEEADAVVAEALSTLGDLAENEDFLLNFKTKKKKLQEARIMSLANILKFKGAMQNGTWVWQEDVLSSCTMQQVRKYCIKDNDFFIRVFEKIPFYNEAEFISLLIETAEKIKQDKELTGTNLYRNKDYSFFRGIIWLLDHYTEEKAVETVKKIMAFESGKEGLCFEAAIGSHVLSDYLQGSRHRACRKLLASLGEQYGGYYVTDSFVASLKLEEPEAVYDRFAIIASKKYPKATTTITQILEELHDQDTQVLARTKRRARYYYYDASQYITVDGNRRTHIDLDHIKWDPRWMKFAEAHHVNGMMLFFLIKCVSEKERKHYKKYFVQNLETWKKQAGEEEYTRYTNLSGAKRSEYIDELVCLVTGLCVTGAKEEALSCADFFVAHLQSLEDTFFANLEKEDLKYVDQLERKISGFKENKGKKIKAFVDSVREHIGK